MSKTFERFNLHQRLQHGMMFTSFIICTFTGVPIKYSQATWAQTATNFFGGLDNMLIIHLIGASIMLASSVYHLAYMPIYSLIKRKISLAVLPAPQDLRDFWQNLLYLLGKKSSRPQFGRYSYKEKFDYWAVFWGMFIMGGSGLMLWFPDFAAKYLPRWVIESSRAAHTDEAMLAILAIFVWHFFNVHFSPDFFPMSRVWYSGQMSPMEMAHEHPRELAALEGIPLEALAHPVDPRPGGFTRTKTFIIAEIIFYGAILVWFVYFFLPLGFK